VIRLLTSESVPEFTIVVYRDPNHPLSPSTSPRSLLFMPSQPPHNMTIDSSSYPEPSVVAKRPSPGPELHISTTAGTSGSPAVSFVPRPTSADVGKSPHTADAGKLPSAAIKTVTYNIGDSASVSVEPPMPVMRLHHDMTSMSPRGSASAGVEPVMKMSQCVPCHDSNLLFASPPAPQRTSTGSGVKDLFDALEKTYHASQQVSSDHSRASFDASVTSATVGQGSATDKKRHSIDVRLCFAR